MLLFWSRTAYNPGVVFLRCAQLAFSIAALPLAIWFLWSTLRPELPVLHESMHSLPAGVFAVVLGLELLNHLINAFLWQHVFKKCCVRAEHVKLSTVIGVLGLSGLGKYIPGRVWPLAWQGFLFKRWEIDPINTLVVAVITNGYSLLAGLLVGGVAFVFADIPTGLRLGAGIASLAVGALLVLGPLYAARLFPDAVRGRFAGIPPKTAFWISIGYVACWALHASGGVLLALTISPQLRGAEGFRIMGAMCASLIVGAAALLAPGGIGVREAGLYHALVSLPTDLRVRVSVYSRLTILVAEGIVASIGLLLMARLWWRRKKSPQKSSSPAVDPA
jgi:hypothetical protein